MRAERRGSLVWFDKVRMTTWKTKQKKNSRCRICLEHLKEGAQDRLLAGIRIGLFSSNKPGKRRDDKSAYPRFFVV